MLQTPIIILCGAISPEREVSLRSGAACLSALRETFRDVQLHVLDSNELPPFLDPLRHVVFPLIHGDYGENGGIQHDLAARGIEFAGSTASASRLCMDKVETKKKLKETHLPVAPDFTFYATDKPTPAALASALGTTDIVLKPAASGSSIGVHFVSNIDEITAALAKITQGKWMAEPRLRGREMTIGIIQDKAAGIVEIIPADGRYDFATKYTSGSANYLFPAKINASTESEITRATEHAYHACSCRDFARLDFILHEDDSYTFLEINTIPGLTETSLLPKSALCHGISFPALCARMISPAITRFTQQNR
ncbi:MAG: D-alanine--D-alanine ligase [Puniceicoccales bacterium]|jgi:D-alanine-D-alanine ligase|nr:D-alanine--D-alanine ligase [Puniceicoccales bacterium]